MQKSQIHSLQITSSIYELAEVQKWFNTLRSMPERVWQQINLVLVEGFTNVVYHAHEHLPEETPIDIEVKIFSDCVELRIWDCGQPFDLLTQKDSLISQQQEIYDVEDIPTGGRGLLIMKTIADLISYERTPDQRNCLFVRKNYSPANKPLL